MDIKRDIIRKSTWIKRGSVQSPSPTGGEGHSPHSPGSSVSSPAGPAKLSVPLSPTLHTGVLSSQLLLALPGHDCSLPRHSGPTGCLQGGALGVGKKVSERRLGRGASCVGRWGGTVWPARGSFLAQTGVNVCLVFFLQVLPVPQTLANTAGWRRQSLWASRQLSTHHTTCCAATFLLPLRPRAHSAHFSPPILPLLWALFTWSPSQLRQQKSDANGAQEGRGGTPAECQPGARPPLRSPVTEFP